MSGIVKFQNEATSSPWDDNNTISVWDDDTIERRRLREQEYRRKTQSASSEEQILNIHHFEATETELKVLQRLEQEKLKRMSLEGKERKASLVSRDNRNISLMLRAMQTPESVSVPVPTSTETDTIPPTHFSSRIPLSGHSTNKNVKKKGDDQGADPWERIRLLNEKT
jgi:hypothetical protein